MTTTYLASDGNSDTTIEIEALCAEEAAQKYAQQYENSNPPRVRTFSVLTLNVLACHDAHANGMCESECSYHESQDPRDCDCWEEWEEEWEDPRGLIRGVVLPSKDCPWREEHPMTIAEHDGGSCPACGQLAV